MQALLLLLLGGVAVASGQVIKRKWIISHVPYHRQVTEYACGAAALEMVLKYHDARLHVDQKNIMDVARTSEEQGTSSVDMVRAARFSVLSSAASLRFPDEALLGGYTGRPYGFPAFGYSASEPWLDALVPLVQANVPVIVLHKWSLNDTEGHWRVVVGYDLDADKMILLDPWDRDGAPRVLTVSTATFIQLWNKTDDALPAASPFFGMAILPLEMTLLGLNVTTAHGSLYSKNVTVQTRYRCLPPFNCSDPALALEHAQARLDWGATTPCDTSGACWMQPNLPQQRNVSPNTTIMPTQPFGSPQSWILNCDQTRSGISCPRVFEQSWIRVSYFGIFSGQLPPVYCCGPDVVYPPTHYMDVIGESVTLPLTHSSPSR